MTLYRWATSEKEAAELQAKGWKIASARMCHHNFWAILLTKTE